MFHETRFQPETRLSMEAKRKKWTAREEVTDAVLKFREKRKWQLAFRRYVLERNTSQMYAPYFGLDIENYRKWIELQFTNELSWGNFGTAWQFDHIVSVAYFDFSIKADLLLCWNFINVRVEKLESNSTERSRIDILGAKPYFQELYKKTGFSICNSMIEKINQIESSNTISEPQLENFIISNKELLERTAQLTAEELSRLNKGTSLSDIFMEREILRKFG